MLHRTLPALVLLAAACGGPARHTPPPPAPSPLVTPTGPDEPEIDPVVLAHLDHLSLRLVNDDPAVRIRAAGELAEYGPEARPVLAFLIACMVTDDEAPAEACALAVAAVGDEAIPHLERVISSRPDRRALAERTLALIEETDGAIAAGQP